MNKENMYVSHNQEKYFLQTFSLIKRLIAKKLDGFHRREAEDVAQQVALRLWVWKENRSAQNLSAEEWQKIANTAAQNEIKKFYTKESRKNLISSETLEEDSCASLIEKLQAVKMVGNSKTEVQSLLLQLWKEIPNHSLRENYALLLKSADFICYLRAYRCAGKKETAAVLRLSDEELTRIIKLLPLTDKKIAALLTRNLKTEVTAKQIVEARHRARAKLHRAVAGTNPPHPGSNHTKFHERTFTAGKT